MAGMHKTAIVVECGVVVGVYSTLPPGEHEIELLDLDTNDGDMESAEDIEARVNEIAADPEYHKYLD